jgi:hypothetical protein
LEAAATAHRGEGGSEGKGRRGEGLAGGGKVFADEVLVAERGSEREGGVLGDEFRCQSRNGGEVVLGNSMGEGGIGGIAESAVLIGDESGVSQVTEDRERM